MADMQQPVAKAITRAPSAPQNPAVPPPPTEPGVGQLPPPSTPPPSAALDLSQLSVAQLRRILSELQNQRQTLANRRQSTEGSYDRAGGVSKEGLGARLKELDANIIAYEREIARVGQAYAIKGGTTSAPDPPPSQGVPGGYIPEEDAAGMAFGFSFMTLLLTFFVTRRLMRRKYAGLPAAKQQPNLIASNERLERIEQAVDTIAVEVERVSENQRFMTRLMTETQLGDTIKDVRKSTELAKSAAEPSG